MAGCSVLIELKPAPTLHGNHWQRMGLQSVMGENMHLEDDNFSNTKLNVHQ